MKRLAMKFGGTSLGNADAISQAAEICIDAIETWEQIVIVVSAMSGVTDELLRGATLSANGQDGVRQIREDLLDLHVQVSELLITDPSAAKKIRSSLAILIEKFEESCGHISSLGAADGPTLDLIASIGERCSARLFATVLQERGLGSEAVDASELIVTDDRFQNAAPDMLLTKENVSERLLPIMESGIVPVVTGFIGATPSGEITTLGRGGSDYSAAILSACSEADELWIWTDVDGVMTADPGIVPQARIVEHLSYREVAELAYFGAKVLHPKTIQPLVDRQTPIWIYNTFKPDRSGTHIVDEPQGVNGRIKAVTAIQGLSMVTVEGSGMIGVPGIAARTFSAVAEAGVSVLMISQASSEQSICFVVPQDTAESVVAAVEKVMEKELARRDITRIWALKDIVIVTAVGAGLRETPGIAARIFGALGKANINVIAIAQGSSECSLSLVVKSRDERAAVRAIHDAVIVDA